MKQTNPLDKYDVLIVGAGIVGLMFAAKLHKALPHLDVLILQDKKPVLDWDSNDCPDRVSAINRASQKLFESLGLWENILTEATPYLHMLVWDAKNQAKMEFDRLEMGERDLGHIIPNRIMQKTLWESLESAPHVDLLTGSSPESLEVFDDYVEVTLGDKKVQTKLLVGADGVFSWVHTQAGFKRHEQDYNHVALTACVTFEKSHKSTAYQCFFEDEILAFLPLQNKHEASIVWSVPPEKAEILTQLSEKDLAEKMEVSIGGKLGKIEKIQKIKQFPLKLRHSESYIKNRIALIGDAIHTIHPLAGQGMNLGLADANDLVEVLRKAHEKRKDLGVRSVLRQYERARVGDNWRMIFLMEGIKRFFANKASTVVALRAFGLNRVNQSQRLKKFFVKAALGLKEFS